MSADLDHTVNAVRNTVSELQTVANWLSASGKSEVVVLGVSLGSCIAGLMSALKSPVKRFVLVLSAGDFAQTVWEGRATRHVRARMEGNISLEELRSTWAEISPENYVRCIREHGSQLFLINGRYDGVVPTQATKRFALKLGSAGVPIKTAEFWCGHYTMGLFPFNVLVTLGAIRYILKPRAPI